jgi:hypothetical protein
VCLPLSYFWAKKGGKAKNLRMPKVFSKILPAIVIKMSLKYGRLVRKMKRVCNKKPFIFQRFQPGNQDRCRPRPPHFTTLLKYALDPVAGAGRIFVM